MKINNIVAQFSSKQINLIYNLIYYKYLFVEMGGHGGLNILPQKKWNVYNWDNR